MSNEKQKEKKKGKKVSSKVTTRKSTKKIHSTMEKIPIKVLIEAPAIYDKKLNRISFNPRDWKYCEINGS